MAYGIFYVQCEITRKNGRLPDVEEAIELAEQRFSECDQNPCGTYPTLAEAQEELAKLKCELCPAQFLASGRGYDAYMYQVIELGNGDGYGFAEWAYPHDDEEDWRARILRAKDGRGGCVETTRERAVGRWSAEGTKMNGIKRYINENYDTGFLTPETNFAIACAAYVLAALGFIFGA